MDGEPIKFHMDYIIGEEVWRIECKMLTRLDEDNFPSCKALDVISIVSAESETGVKVDAESLKAMMSEQDVLAEFWVEMIDYVARITLSIMYVTPGEA